MTFLSIPAIRCGGPQNLPHSTILKTGPLTALLEQGELRRVMLGDVEVVRRIYVGLRGPDWAAIPNVMADLKSQVTEKDFVVSYTIKNQQGDFDFSWKIEIHGDALGQIVFKAHGKAESNFNYNRASICVLHPLKESIGKKVHWVDSLGAAHTGNFPEFINPQQPFLNTQAIEYEVSPELVLSLKYTGDEFEMEDQRNWSDGSFKTYSPPQARQKPFKATAGFEMIQTVTLGLRGNLSSVQIREPLVRLTQELHSSKILPRIGFGVSSAGTFNYSDLDLARLKNLKPQHLRANIRLLHTSYSQDLQAAVNESTALKVPLEIALVIPEKNEGEKSAEAYLIEFKTLYQSSGAKVIRWLLFSETADAISQESVSTAIKILRDDTSLKTDVSTAQFVIGSKSDFVLLNRNRPTEILVASEKQKQNQIQTQIQSIGLTHVLTGQVHLTDNRTLVESLEGQSWILKSLDHAWPGKNISVSSVTLKRSPFVQSIKKSVANLNPNLWKGQVDSRQFSLFGAAWTFASLTRLTLDAPRGAMTATYFETTGLLGLLAGHESTELKVPGTDFELQKNWVYPLYHVFADFAEFKSGTAAEIKSSHPLHINALQFNLNNTTVILITNLDSNPIQIDLTQLTQQNQNRKISSLRRLNELTAPEAMENPELFRTRNHLEKSENLAATNTFSAFNLMPFEFIRINLESLS